MPSANRLVFVRDTVRSHPVMVATTAATIGVLLGGFITVEALAPVKPKTESAASQQVAVKSPAVVKPVAETTGSAASKDSVASTNCDKQTWPYLSRDCADQLRDKPRGPRVIATDKLDKSTVTAMEAQPLQPPAPPVEQAPPAPAIASATPPPAAVSPPANPPAPAIASTTPPAANASPPVVAALAPVASSPEPVKAEVAETPQQPAEGKAEVKKEKNKRIATKAKRKARPAAQPDSDDDANTVANNDSGERTAGEDQSDSRTYRRSGKRPHIVARWIERVPADDGDGDRQVTVRRGGGGLFETLFGVGRANADDD